MANATKNEVWEFDGANKAKRARITIAGDGTLVLNKMNARNTRQLLADDRKKVKEQPNYWEDIVTSIHWEKPLPFTNTYKECNEENVKAIFNPENKDRNRPCITSFGLKKSFGQAVVRNEIDKYSTKLDNALNIIAKNNLVPIDFAEWGIDEKLMQPQKGSPIVARLNQFSGWTASFDILYTDNVYSLKEITNIINLAGFGLGIGSGRSSGYGRYHVVSVQPK